MIVDCEKCGHSYDDSYRWTICPHETFAANDGQNNFAHHPESHLSESQMFCGWPVKGKPCGKPATPSCAYCDEHGEAFDHSNRLTEKDIVAGATARRRRQEKLVELLIAAVVVGVMLLMTYRAWLYAHREFWWGVLVGSVVQALVLSRSWVWDRVLWMRWFSR